MVKARMRSAADFDAFYANTMKLLYIIPSSCYNGPDFQEWFLNFRSGYTPEIFYVIYLSMLCVSGLFGYGKYTFFHTY